MRTDKIELLEVFIRIVDSGSISNAAREYEVEVSTISRKLNKLEEYLQQSLVNRSTHELALTDAGQRFYHDASRLISQWQRLEERYSGAQTHCSGDLKIIAPVGMGQQFMTTMLVDFQKRYPDIRTSWILKDEPIKFAETGCDLWVRLGDDYDESLVNHKLGITDRTLVAAPQLISEGKPRTTSSIESLPCIALDPIDGGRIELTSLQSQKTKVVYPEVIMSTNNFFALHTAISEGLGFGILPRWFIEEDLKSGRLVELLPGWKPQSLSINVAYLAERYQSLSLGLFIEHLSESLKNMNGIRAFSYRKVIGLDT